MSSNTNTTVSVIVSPTDNNKTQHISALMNGEVSEITNNKVELSNTNEDGIQKHINELKI